NVDFYDHIEILRDLNFIYVETHFAYVDDDDFDDPVNVTVDYLDTHPVNMTIDYLDNHSVN
ncbi:2353_t:CDS:1, partial [Acaulospora colombiana]